MIRSQIFLTEQEHSALKRLAHLRGQSYSSILRGYLDQALGISPSQKFHKALHETAGKLPKGSLRRSIAKLRTLW